jgi:hypothetical protein
MGQQMFIEPPNVIDHVGDCSAKSRINFAGSRFPFIIADAQPRRLD